MKHRELPRVPQSAIRQLGGERDDRGFASPGSQLFVHIDSFRIIHDPGTIEEL
jgi:hypothetical protein